MGVWGRGSEGPNWSPGLLDRAETFAESSVSVTSDAAIEVANEGLQFMSGADSLSLGTEGDQNYDATSAGVIINPNVATSEVYLETSSLNDGSTTADARIVRQSDGTIVAEKSDISVSGTFTFSVSLEAGVSYRVVIRERNGNTWSPGHDSTKNYPRESPTFDIVDGYFNGSGADPYTWTTVELTAAPTSGSTTVEWPMPADVAGWDIIPYETTENGGTVEVYAVDASDGTRLAGPLDDPGDISSLSRSTNVAVEVALSRPSTSENPRLEAVYRRRKVT